MGSHNLDTRQKTVSALLPFALTLAKANKEEYEKNSTAAPDDGHK